MSTSNKPPPTDQLDAQLAYLKLLFIHEHYASLAKEAAQAHWGYVEFLARLITGEALLRQERSIQPRIRQARFPVVKTLEQFQWSWPRKINRLQVQELFRLQFLADKANVIFLGGVGLGKTHLATALGYAACLPGHAVRFATAVDVINTWPPRKRPDGLSPSWTSTSSPRSSSWTSLDTFRSTRPALTCSSRSSAIATSAAPRSSPPTASTRSGQRSSITTTH
jgi:hypothetical protein